MKKIPIISGKKMVKILQDKGFITTGRKGSHVKLKKKNDKVHIVIVPMHKELAIGTLRAILRQANMTIEELIELL